MLAIMGFISLRHERQTTSIRGGEIRQPDHTKIDKVESLTWYENIDPDGYKSLYLFTKGDQKEDQMTMDKVVKNYLKSADNSFITNQAIDIPTEKGRVIIHKENETPKTTTAVYKKAYNKLPTDTKKIIDDQSEKDENVIDIVNIVSGNYGKYIIYKDKENIQKMKDLLKQLSHEGIEYTEIPTNKL